MAPGALAIISTTRDFCERDVFVPTFLMSVICSNCITDRATLRERVMAHWQTLWPNMQSWSASEISKMPQAKTDRRLRSKPN